MRWPFTTKKWNISHSFAPWFGRGYFKSKSVLKGCGIFMFFLGFAFWPL
jgi:hypothetical protein